MAAMLRRHQAQVGVLSDRRMAVAVERNERVVLCLNEQRWHANSDQEPVGGLRAVVVRGGPESERLGGEPVIELVDAAHIVQALGRIQVRVLRTTRPVPGLQAVDEAALVEDVLRPHHLAATGLQVDRCGDRANRGNQVRFSQFAGQLQDHVSTQGKANQVRRRQTLSSTRPKDAVQISGEARMVECAGMRLRAAAGPHVQPVRPQPGVQTRLRQTYHIAAGA